MRSPPHVLRVRRVFRSIPPDAAQSRMIWVAALGGFEEVIRVRYLDARRRDCEVSFLESETPTIAPWLAGVISGQIEPGELPVAEYAEAKWDPIRYRWTFLAWGEVRRVKAARLVRETCASAGAR
jgi:hypothetical protein